MSIPMDLFSDDIKIESLDNAIKLFKESRKGFIKLFNNSPICMSMTTTTLDKRTYVRVNNEFLNKFGYSEEEIIGRTSIEIGILEPEESQRVRKIIKEKGRLQNDYVKCIAKNGKVVHTVSSIEYMDMNEETYLVAFFIDVTRIMEQQSIIERHVEQLEAVNKELEAFSYSISHDLRAPLRAIDGYAKMLEEDFFPLLNDEGKRALLTVQRNARKMGTLIDDLLDFARLGKKAVQKTTIDMDALVLDVMIDLKKTANPNTVLKNSPLAPAWGDYALIRQVVVTLLSNAIKYSSKKEFPVVEISSYDDGSKVIYTVRDNGAGFDLKYKDKLFGVFQRLHTTEQFEGTGVGLATAYRIVNKHGGALYVEDAQVEKGAVFSFWLPVQPQ